MNAVEKKLLFIVNPRAGKTKSRAPLFDAVSIFSKAGYLVRVAETRLWRIYPRRLPGK